MSSNSSADRPARRLLESALAVLHAEARAHHDRLCEAFARLAVHVIAGDEAIMPVFAGDRLVAADAAGRPAVTLRMGLATFLALLDAQRTLIEAIERGELDVRGSADALDAAAAAFSTFLHGLVRAPSSRRLLDELRREVVRPVPEIRT